MNVGIDIGATKTLLAGFNAKGQLLVERKFPTPKSGSTFLKTLGEELSELAQAETIKKMVVGAPGAVDKKNLIFIKGGVIGWNNVDLKPALHKFTKKVLLENDAKLAGLAEARHGAGKDFGLVLYVTISSGIGNAVVQNGKLLLPKSEGGQTIGANLKYKNFEDLSSGTALKTRFGKYGYQIKDSATWTAYSKDLAVGLYNMITIIEPDVLVLGGGVAVHFSKFKVALKTELELLNSGIYSIPPLRQAKFIETAVIEGCRALMLGEKEEIF